MHESSSRREAANDNLTMRTRALMEPARIAIASVLIGGVMLLGAVASAEAGSGGGVWGGGGDSVDGNDLPGGGGGGGGENSAGGATVCPASELGSRTLALGDCGDDVRTLNWLLKSKHLPGVPLADKYGASTEAAVRDFERSAGLETDGVLEPATHNALAESMASQIATWYGPGFYGNETACGETLTREMVGVAHKTLPCGTRVVVRYGGTYVRTTVIDRGPYANGASWDLTGAAADLLGFEGVEEIQVAKLARAKRK